MTNAVNELALADLLIIMGCNMADELAVFCRQYFKGDKIILINSEHHYLDEEADVICHQTTREVLPHIVA